MNKFILAVMNRENHTQEELNENRDAAHAYAYADDAYAYAYAAYAYDADDAAAAYADDDCEYWVNRYFERTGEDKQTYIDELENKS